MGEEAEIELKELAALAEASDTSTNADDTVVFMQRTVAFSVKKARRHGSQAPALRQLSDSRPRLRQLSGVADLPDTASVSFIDFQSSLDSLTDVEKDELKQMAGTPEWIELQKEVAE